MQAAIDPHGLTIQFAETILFATGEVTIADAGRVLLARVAPFLASLAAPREIVVEGHADPRPIYNATYAHVSSVPAPSVDLRASG